MVNKILSTIVFMLAVMLTACSSDPFVGQWIPDTRKSNDAITQINGDGTVKIYGDATDGSYSIKGKWSRVEGEDNTIQINYDASTIQVDLDNPIANEITRGILKEMASDPLTLTLSEDGEKLYGGGKGYFVKI